MDLIFEFLLDLILEGSIGVSIEASKNKKLSKFIRYPLIAIIIAFFLAVIVGLIFLGIALMDKQAAVGVGLIILAIVFLILSIIKFRKVYLKS